jgi:putative membrane protein
MTPMTSSKERKEWLQKTPDDARAKKLSIAAWIVTALVLTLVVMMRSPYKIPLPDGWSMAFLPPVHAVINTLVSFCLIAAIITVKQGKITAHRNFIFAAMLLSTLFLLCYVAYHFTTEETRYGGDGAMRMVYFLLLITHIVFAAISLPMILLTFIAAWTNRFEAHRKMARWVFPIWLYVALTGPICYLMLRPYYP